MRTYRCQTPASVVLRICALQNCSTSRGLSAARGTQWPSMRLIARRKPGNAHGRAVRQQWMFGGVDLATKEFFMQLVPSRHRVVLQLIIQTHILPGTTIWSDHWGGGVRGFLMSCHSSTSTRRSTTIRCTWSRLLAATQTTSSRGGMPDVFEETLRGC